MPITSPQRFRFGDGYELDLGAYELRRDGRALKLPRIPMELLTLLIEQRGNLVMRDEIIERIWGREVFVDTDNSINAAVRKIRRALRDDADEPQFIQTVPAKGYRFVAAVTEIGAAPGNSSVATELVAVSDAIQTPETVGAERIRPDHIDPEQPNLGAGSQAPAETKSKKLRRWAILSAVVLVTVTAIEIYARYYRVAEVSSPPTRVLLAVLPFENLTGDPGQEYFSDGLTEEMITELGRLDPERLGVIGRTSVMLYKQNPKRLDQIGRELGVQYLLEGSVRRDSSNVRITAQLIQVKDQTHVWAREYDRELKDLLAVQAEIAQEVTDEITLTLSNRRAAAAASHSPVTHAATSYEAYDLYLEGRYFWNQRTETGFKRAADYFQKAIAKDPNYAPAYAGLADTFGLMSTWLLAPQVEFMPKARKVALKALELDESLAEAHTSLALIAENYDYDWGTAEKEFRRAIQLNPDYPTAHQWYAESLAWQGRFDEAFAESDRARQLDPMSMIIARDYSRILYFSRQYERAITQSRAVNAMSGLFAWNGIDYFSHIEQGKYAEALTEIRGSEDDPQLWATRAYLYGRWRQKKQFQHALARFEQLAPKLGFSRTSWSVLAYAGSSEDGAKGKVLALLEDACREHSSVLTQIKVDPQYDRLRNDSRFQELLRQVGLSDQQHPSVK
jgi:TolB-like protein/DNA-binding winged helix-turn-helix (wHTH) protein